MSLLNRVPFLMQPAYLYVLPTEQRKPSLQLYRVHALSYVGHVHAGLEEFTGLAPGKKVHETEK